MDAFFLGETNQMKPKRSQARLTFVIAACFLAILSFLFSCLLAFAFPQAPRYAEAMVTAEFLDDYRLQAPSFMLIDEACVNVSHCFTIFLERFPAMSAFQMQRMAQRLVLRIDSEVQREYFVQLLGSSLYAEIPPLGDGLHLIEMEITDKDHRTYRHSWVIRTSSGIAAPATQALPPTPSGGAK
jgi:hypothetical protein